MLVTKSIARMDAKPIKPFQYNEPFSFEVREMGIEELAQWVSSGGFFKAGIYDIKECRSRKIDKQLGDFDGAVFGKGAAKGSSIICLDFDSIEQSPQEIVEVLAGNGILPNFMYYSYSQDPNKKWSWITDDYINIYSRQETGAIFSSGASAQADSRKYKSGYNFRLVWCLDSVLGNEEYEDLYKKLLDFCEEKEIHPDPATKDISRIWWGGVLGYEMYSDECVNIKASLGWEEISKRISKTNNARIARIINAKNELIEEYKIEVEFPQIAEVDEQWWTRLRGRCQLWDKYENGEYLNHNERLTLFTNLKFLKHTDNSFTIYKDVMQFYNPKVWEGHSFDEVQLKSWLMNKSLGAYPIVRGNGGIYQTIADFFRGVNKDRPQIPNKRNRVSVAELDEWLDRNIPIALDSNENNYFKSQTASGKTDRIINYLIDKVENVFGCKYIVALPYNSSIIEFVERWKAKSDADLFPQPVGHDYTDIDLARLRLGLGKESKNPEKAEFIKKLQSEECRGVFVVTHATLLCLPYVPCDRIIIDENIEDALVKEYVFSKAQIRTITDFVPAEKRHYIDQLCSAIESTESGKVEITSLGYFLYDFENNINDYIDCVPPEIHPVGIFQCKHEPFGRKCKEGVRVTVKTPLVMDAMKGGTPITLFTATPQMNKLNDLYGQSFEMIEAPAAINEGSIVQFTCVSGARGVNNAKLIGTFRKIKDVLEKRYEKPLEDYILLTFKLGSEFQEQVRQMGFIIPTLEDGTQIHVDNCAGLDCLKGQDIIVAAKKDLPPDHYLKVYEDLTGEVESSLPMNWYQVEMNGIKSSCYLYEDSRIRSRQMEYINKISAQAVGRARALRESYANVYYFSDYPIDDCDRVYYE